jgi:hypothetical protein
MATRNIEEDLRADISYLNKTLLEQDILVQEQYDKIKELTATILYLVQREQKS